MKFFEKLKRKRQEGLFRNLFEEWIWIAGYMRRYPLQILLYILLGVFGTGLGLLASVISRDLIDAVTGFNSASIGPTAALYVGMGLGNIAVTALTGRISIKVSTKVHQEIRADIFDHILNTDWEAMAGFHSGDLLNRASGDAGVVSGAVLSFVPGLVTGLTQFVGALIIILRNDPTMALIALGSAPIMVLSSQYLMRKMRAHQMESRKISSEIMVFNSETFQNIQFIKSFDLIGRFSRKMRDLQQKNYEVTMRHNLFSIATGSVMSLTGRLISYATYGWGIYRLWRGDISYGTMTLFMQMAGSLSGAFSSLINIAPTMLSTGTSARRVMDIVQLRQEDRSLDAKARELLKKSASTGIRLRLDNVRFAYKDGKTVFEGVNLQAGPGDIIALVGPSGEGKTTLLRVLLGLVNIHEGEAQIGLATSPDQMPIDPSTRRFFSYVPQDNTLFSASIADNLRMVKADATEEELRSVLRAACIEDAVMALPEGINSMVGERGHGFSHGQAQRLSIARALLSSAPVMLLDEATSALDVATERKVLRNLLRHDAKKTVILTTHRPSVLELSTRSYLVGGHQVKPMDEEGLKRYFRDY